MNNTDSQQSNSSMPPEFYTVLFSIMASGGTFIIKAFFEKYNAYYFERNNSIRKERFSRLKDKLSNFYWPIYIRLLRAEQLWSKISNVDKILDTHREEQDITHHHDTHHHDTHHIGLGGFSPKNDEDLAAFKIQRCFRQKYFDKKRTKMSKISKVLSNHSPEKFFNLSINLNDFDNDIEKNIHSLDNNLKHEQPNLNVNLTLKAEFLRTCDKMLLASHIEISKIIESKINIAEPNKELSNYLLKYLRHTALFSLLRESNEYNVWPSDFGEPYPERLKLLIEKETNLLQEEYNNMMDLKMD